MSVTEGLFILSILIAADRWDVFANIAGDYSSLDVFPIVTAGVYERPTVGQRYVTIFSELQGH